MRSKHGRREKADPHHPPCENPDRAGNPPHNNTSRRDSRGAEARGRIGGALDTPLFLISAQPMSRLTNRRRRAIYNTLENRCVSLMLITREAYQPLLAES